MRARSTSRFSFSLAKSSCSCCRPAAIAGERSIESPRALAIADSVCRTPTPCLRSRYAVMTAAEVLVPLRQLTRIFLRFRAYRL